MILAIIQSFSSKNGGVYIGNNVAIAANCYIIDSDHGIEKDKLIRNQRLVSGKVCIEDNVWIAESWKHEMNKYSAASADRILKEGSSYEKEKGRY